MVRECLESCHGEKIERGEDLVEEFKGEDGEEVHSHIYTYISL